MKSILFVLLITALFYSCSKEDSESVLKETITNSEKIPNSENYYPLKKGNWWVYDYFSLVTSIPGEEHFTYRDSVFIVGDTVINGHNWAIQKSSYHKNLSFLRDSSGYMLTRGSDKILFSCSNFIDTFRVDKSLPPYTIYSKMMHVDTLIATPRGNFHSISRAYIWRNNDLATPKNEYLFFANGIGLVQYCHWFYPACVGKLEGRLVKYHLN